MTRLNKKGSHVGFMLSFVIFVVFLLFMYTIINSRIVNPEDEGLIEGIKENFIEELRTNLTVVTIFKSSEGGYNCVSFDASEFPDYYVVREDGNIVNSEKVGDDLRMEYGQEDTLFKIYFSEEGFNDYPTSNSDCVSASIDSISAREEILQGSVMEMQGRYQGFYEELKSSLGVPSEKEFSFTFEYANGSLVEPGKSEAFGNVYTKEVSVIYVDLDGNFVEGKLRLRLW
jgi:hypothetical protein